MDIKEKISEIVDKIKEDKSLLTRFKEAPVKVIEELIGIDLPDETIEKVVDGVKAKLAADDIADKLDDIGDKLGGIGDKLGGLFKK
ncbi:MAG: hypothetical protein J6I45_02870 [Clostridia bacterium]|nr:hypothetical protein [Clostridia bacterium]